MQKILSLVLCFLMVTSLAACGEEDTAATTTPTATTAPQVTETIPPTTEAPEGANAQAISLGQTITLDYAVATLETLEMTSGYHFKYSVKDGNKTETRNTVIPCPTGYKLICLTGKFTNKAGYSVNPADDFFSGRLILNGEAYEGILRCYDVEKAQSYKEIAPNEEVDYFLCFQVPADYTDNIESCSLYIGFILDLDPTMSVTNLNHYDQLYLLETIPTAA